MIGHHPQLNMPNETFLETFHFLGPASFPPEVTEALHEVEWDATSPTNLSRVAEQELGVEEVPPYFRTVVAGRDWDDLLDRQLLATLYTFLYAEREAEVEYSDLGESTGQYLRFVVDDLPNQRTISLVYPGYKNRFDYDLRVDDWYPDAETVQSPRHWHLFSDFFWKYKQTRLIDDAGPAASSLREAVTDLRDGQPPSTVLPDLSEGAFSVGRRLPVLLGILPWFFIEEDINYPQEYYGGKEMPYEVLDRLATLSRDEYEPGGATQCPFAEPASGGHAAYHAVMADLPNYETDLQDNCEIVRTPHAIRPECPSVHRD
jgi:hypothetical protein